MNVQAMATCAKQKKMFVPRVLFHVTLSNLVSIGGTTYKDQSYA